MNKIVGPFSMIAKIASLTLAALILVSCSLSDGVASEAAELKYEIIDVSYAQPNWWDIGVGYPRIIQVQFSQMDQNGYLLASFEEGNAGLVIKPGYPIWRSRDEGISWEKLTFVSDNVFGMNAEWQPSLYELPKRLGKWEAGTILLAACSVDPSHKIRSNLKLYASTDGGVTWSEPTTIATGGGLETGVWEPELEMLDDGTLVCYYSDSTDAVNHSQKVVLKTSRDGVEWSDAIDIISSPIQTDRPGMPVVTRLGDQSYFMVYEVVGRDGNPIMYRTSTDGLNWGDPKNLGKIIESTDGKSLGSAPYCAWMPVGSANGTLIVSGTFMRSGTSETGTDYFISHDYGKTWSTIPNTIPYTREFDHLGYSSGFTFSKDGEYLYAMKNITDPNLPGKAKIVFSASKVKEIIAID